MNSEFFKRGWQVRPRQFFIRAAGLLCDIIAPKVCSGCGRYIYENPKPWCPECWQNLPWLSCTICIKCGRPFDVADDLVKDLICGECFLNPPYEKVRSVCKYEGVPANLIIRFKYSGALYLHSTLLALLIEGFKRHFEGDSIDLIVPVPLHKDRLKERGYNQSALLARSLAHIASIPLSFSTVVRTRYTIPQVRLRGKERRQNVKGAFAVPNKAIHKVKSNSILVIDDVVTTGTTFHEVALALKKAGAAKVYGLAIARSVT